MEKEINNPNARLSKNYSPISDYEDDGSCSPKDTPQNINMEQTKDSNGKKSTFFSIAQ